MAAVEPEDFVGRGGFVFDVPAEVAALAVAVASSLSAVIGVGVRPLAIAAAATGGAADVAGAAMTMGEAEVTVSDTAGAAGSADDFAAFRLDASEMYKSQPLRLTLHSMQLRHQLVPLACTWRAYFCVLKREGKGEGEGGGGGRGRRGEEEMKEETYTDCTPFRWSSTIPMGRIHGTPVLMQPSQAPFIAT